MKSQKTKHIDKVIKEKYKLTQDQLEAILTAPFDFQVQNMKGVLDMKNEVYPSIRIPNFGLFHVPNYIRDKYKKNHGTIPTE